MSPHPGCLVLEFDGAVNAEVKFPSYVPVVSRHR